MNYNKFIQSKIKYQKESGFEIYDSDIHPKLFDFQRDIVKWSVKQGKSGIFAMTGLGKTFMQVEYARIVSEQNKKQPISPHWMDKFNEFASANNEPWRSDLLAKALALEAKDPSCVGPRALWFIGTIDEYIFHAYATLIDLSSFVAGHYVIPNFHLFGEDIVPNCVLGNKTINQLTFILSDLGLIGEPITSQIILPQNYSFTVQYGHRFLSVENQNKLFVKGILQTTLGKTITSLYEPSPNLMGQKIMEKWISSLGRETVKITDIK